MLQLNDIVKTYIMGDTRIEALKGVSLEFRKSDFVSILGPSGCGKTTMLNIIGGLDRYTSGDLVINGVSTKEYKDVDWDIYRNNSIGFVFQSYNLISHQTVYTNVELAMTLAGVSRAERHRRVIEALEKVSLGDQINKKPTQMSGGQMQRVSIARALVNNPEILLADEPTGALDSETSLQIMELLKEIAKDRLVIMVTHNPDIAKKYSTRIIKLLDGKAVDDSNPYISERPAVKKEKVKRRKISMSFTTALGLSFKNLLTKKTRTILTAFAGSIGIIGIALILSLSSGMQGYVNNLERDTLSTYPIEILSHSMDMGGMMALMMDSSRGGAAGEREPDRIYANKIATNMVQSVSAQIQHNDLAAFKRHIENDSDGQFHNLTNTIKYGYDVELQIFKADTSGGITQVNPSEVFANTGMNGGGIGGMNMGMGGGMEIWTEMLDNKDLLSSQYDVLAGRWPQAFNEIVLVASRNNELSDMTLYALGLMDSGEIDELMRKVMRGEEIEDSPETSFTFDELLSLTFKLLLNTDFYERRDNGWEDMRDNEEFMISAVGNALELRVVGIIKPSGDAAAASISGSVGYTSALTEYVIGAVLETDIAKAQLADPEINVFTGHAFDIEDFIDNLTIDDINAIISELPEAEQTQAKMMFAVMSEEQVIAMFAERMRANSAADASTFEDNITVLGIADFDNPSSVRLYPRDFDSKTRLEALIEDYNNAHELAGSEQYVINYTDFVGLMTSSISSIIGIVSYVLIAFVAISLVVSSIMIAIITYISVLERTKEIGILRSIGASKKDITRVFNAETVIEGFVAGALGVGVTILLNIPVNAIISSLAGVSGLSSLPAYGAAGLIVISIILTVIAGFIPSKMAAKKDPVVALRTE
ncbi:MAG: ABC transporter ATP-binding protein/permease [Defluviitaleaceae bacterium]|nr:ABC transporter ATP-binding protein/permease [Defluviitaleaceae bacterium]MCL2835443.1 ABC transporter ATP-binding protein/permease [Defluviitaleaceae bacterium]